MTEPIDTPELTPEQIEDIHRYRKESDGTTDWPKVEFDFINSTLGLKAFADKYHLPYPAMSNKSAAGHWMSRKAQIAREVEILAQQQINADRAKELADFNKADLAMAKSIRGLVAARVNKLRKEVEKAKEKDADADVNPNELRTLSATVESTQRIGRLALGAATQAAELTGKDGTPLGGGTAPIIIIGGPPEEGEPMSLQQLEAELGEGPIPDGHMH